MLTKHLSLLIFFVSVLKWRKHIEGCNVGNRGNGITNVEGHAH